MKISLRTTWVAAALAAGVAAAAVASAFYTGAFSFTTTFWHPAVSQNRELANACPAPKSQTDELFFISCGGIY